MTYEIVTIGEKIVVGQSVRTTNAKGQAMKDIGMLWQSCISEDVFAYIANRVDTKSIGLYTDYESDATGAYTFACCCEVTETDNDNNLDVMKISKGKYAKFSIEGDVIVDVGRAWGKIWQMDLDRKYDCDFEVYHHDSENTNSQKIDIYIGLN